MTTESKATRVVTSPEEAMVVFSWTEGQMAMDSPPFGGAVNVRLGITSGSDLQKAMSAELSILMAPVVESHPDLAGSKFDVQMFRYQSATGVVTFWGFCAVCGWSGQNVHLHAVTCKGQCPRCHAKLSRPGCLAHHSFGNCALCEFEAAVAPAAEVGKRYGPLTPPSLRKAIDSEPSLV